MKAKLHQHLTNQHILEMIFGKNIDVSVRLITAQETIAKSWKTSKDQFLAEKKTVFPITKNFETRTFQ